MFSSTDAAILCFAVCQVMQRAFLLPFLAHLIFLHFVLPDWYLIIPEVSTEGCAPIWDFVPVSQRTDDKGSIMSVSGNGVSVGSSARAESWGERSPTWLPCSILGLIDSIHVQ